jgi:hypothetical protein
MDMFQLPEGYGQSTQEQHYAYDPTAYAIVVAKPTPHPTHPPTHPPTHSPTHPPTHPPTHLPTPIHYTTPQPGHNIHKKSIQLMQVDEHGNLSPLSFSFPPVPAADPYSPKPASRFAQERLDSEDALQSLKQVGFIYIVLCNSLMNCKDS